MPRILEQSFDKVYAPFITALLFELFDGSKGPCRGMPRFFGRHSSRNAFEDLIFQMRAPFLIELSFAGVPAQHTSDAVSACSRPPHPKFLPFLAPKWSSRPPRP